LLAATRKVERKKEKRIKKISKKETKDSSPEEDDDTTQKLKTKLIVYFNFKEKKDRTEFPEKEKRALRAFVIDELGLQKDENDPDKLCVELSNFVDSVTYKMVSNASRKHAEQTFSDWNGLLDVLDIRYREGGKDKWTTCCHRGWSTYFYSH
jgi:hypothetical protein